MERLIKKVLLLVAVLFAFAQANSEILVYKIPNKDHKLSAQSVADGFSLEGYVVSKNQDMNTPYKKQFAKTSFYSYNLMSIYHPDFAKKIIEKNSVAGIFVPFSVAVYQRKGDNNMYVSLLSANAMETILKVKDKNFHELDTLNRKTLKSTFPTATMDVSDIAIDNKTQEFYRKYSYEVDDEDAVETYEDMMMMMEGDIKTGGFVVANYVNFNQTLKEKGNNDYMFYHDYSLCKLKVIYELSKKNPEAGAFAPCTMIVAHKKGTNTTELISLNINALITMLSLKDKNILKMLKKTQATMVRIVEDSNE